MAICVGAKNHAVGITRDGNSWHYNDVIMSAMSSQTTWWPFSRLFTQAFIQAQIKEKKSKLRVTGLCEGEFIGHKGPVTRKPFDGVIMQFSVVISLTLVTVAAHMRTDAVPNFRTSTGALWRWSQTDYVINAWGTQPRHLAQTENG